MRKLLIRAGEFDAARTGLYRLLALLAGLVVNLSAIAILTRQFGAGEYAAYALLASFVNLLPFADLGLGASLVNSTSDLGSGRVTKRIYERHLTRVRDLLLLVSAALVAIDLALFFYGGWPILLGTVGNEEGVAAGATITVLCVAIALPLGIGGRVLQGQSRMSTLTRAGLAGPGFQAVIVFASFLLHAPSFWYFLAPGLGFLSVALVSTVLALRRQDFRLARWFSGLGKRNSDDVITASTAVPFVVTSVGFALGFQSHRLLLANLGTPADVASYSVVAQFAGPSTALISVIGQNLWNRYRAGIANGTLDSRDLRAHIGVFAVVGALAASAIVVVVPYAASLLTGGRVSVDLLLALTAGAYVVGVAIHQPSSMVLTDPRGLWVQALFVCLGSAVNVALIVVLIDSMGASSAYVGAAVSILVFQALPSMWIATRRVARINQPLTRFDRRD